MAGRMRIVSVNLNEAPDVVRKFVQSNNVPFPVMLGAASTGPSYNIQAIPSNIVIAPNGTIVYAVEGYDEKGILDAVQKATPHRTPVTHRRYRKVHHRRVVAR